MYLNILAAVVTSIFIISFFIDDAKDKRDKRAHDRQMEALRLRIVQEKRKIAALESKK